MQRAYWTPNADEQSRLEARGIDQLDWKELLRLHHLICLQLVNTGTERATATQKVRQTVRRLVASESPYRPRSAMVWQGESSEPARDRDPDMQGEFVNASLTHLGCLEVYRLDAAHEPTRIAFVSFEELSGVIFEAPTLVRAAGLYYHDGRGEVVLVPMLYGLTWMIGNKSDREGRMTRFVGHLDGDETEGVPGSGMGVGQQDFCICNPNGAGTSLFAIGSVAKISFPLEMEVQGIPTRRTS